MKRLNFGLAAALALTALVAATSASADAKDPPIASLVDAAKIPCTVTDSRFIAGGKLADGSEVKSYEVACKEGLGFVLINKTKVEAPPTAFDCFVASQPDAKGKPNPTACKLPANADPKLGFQPLIDKTGRACPIAKVRFIGGRADQRFYELACTNGDGVILINTQVVGGAAPSVESCVAHDNDAPPLKCELTTSAQHLAVVDQLLAASGKPCTIKDRRYVMEASTGDTYYEIACADGKGYMLAADQTGKLSRAIGCAAAGGIDNGCKLTDARQAATEESGLYSRLAQQAGFDCKVSKYGVYPSKTDGLDVVELQCANRPDGGVGFFPAKGQARVYDCLRAPSQGYSCSMTPTSALYSKLSAQLVAMHRGSCVVSGARSYDVKTDSTDFVEVACADGAPGWVIEYPTLGGQPKDLLNCVQASKIGGGGCQLPTNRRGG